MNLEKAKLIHGWMSEAEMTWLAEQALKAQLVAEVGSWQGRSMRAMADNSTAKFYSVDTWNGTKEDSHDRYLAGKDQDWLFNQFYENLEDHIDAGRVIPVRRPSTMAAAMFRERQDRFDMIFIDAAHDYENVKADIRAWRELVVPGGLLCGHDFDGGRAGVVKAVKELVPNFSRAPGSIWFQRV